MKPVPQAVAEIRREKCERHGCKAVADYHHPCARCENGHWGYYLMSCHTVSRTDGPLTFPSPMEPKGGSGTELKAVLAWWGIKAGPGCSCNALAREMDARGLLWCGRNTFVLVRKMGEEARRRRLRFRRPAACLLVWLAIGRAWGKSLLH